MEQAVNQFNKGLQMDTHPMVAGNDTLTDALNATFITMNGNEVILQNDMGNRKIDSAYLPAGYEPVGIKEYGGVIYVAAFNPLTNRGQIGSFPSPQRKINANNTESDLLFQDFLKKEQVEYTILDGPEYYYDIKTNSITIPISYSDIEQEDIVLHTGDKFSIYSDDIINLLPYIYPYNNKNNLFTFQIGIFNSQNEFIDISDNLKQWDIVGPNNVIYNYYINSQNDIQDNNGSEDLLKYRNKLAINTYSYKMSSPLYLKATLNKVDYVSYSITGDKSGTNYNFYVEVTYTYNCIDKLGENLFQIDFNGLLIDSDEQKNHETVVPEYIEETNQYRLTLNYSIDGISAQNQTQFDYIIKFPLLFDRAFQNNFGVGNNELIYQKSLEQSGSLNTTLFGSDTVLLNGYRYFYNDSTNETTFDIKIQSYPKKNSYYTIIPVIYKKNGEKFCELSPLEGLEGKPPGTGSYTIVFNHSEVKDSGGNYLESREQYYFGLIKKQYNIYNGTMDEDIIYEDPTISNPIPARGLYITTKIFNGNYIGQIHSDTTLRENGGYWFDEIEDYYIENFYDIKYFILSPMLNYSVNTEKLNINTYKSGSKLYKEEVEETNGSFHIIEEYDIVNTLSSSVTVNNIELYPKEIDALLSIKVENQNQVIQIEAGSVERKISDEKIIQNDAGKYIYSKNLTKASDRLTEDKVIENTFDVVSITENYSGIQLTSHYKIDNYVSGVLLFKENIQCKNIITSLADFVQDNFIFLNSSNSDSSSSASSSDNPSWNYIKFEKPFICTDITGENCGIVFLDTFDNAIEAIDNGNRISGIDKSNAQREFNRHILNKTDNFLLLDWNRENGIYGYEPSVELSLNYDNRPQGVKKIWMRVSEDEYTPIFVSQQTSSGESGGQFEDTNNAFLNKLRAIPHYFAYNPNKEMLVSGKVIDYKNCVNTLEFELNIDIDLKLQSTIVKDNNNGLNSLFKLIGFDNNNIEHIYNDEVTINQNVSFKENSIYSNEEIQEEIESLKDFKLNCILSRDSDLIGISNLVQTNHGVNITYIPIPPKILEFVDSEGNEFDPNYVYYVNPNTSSGGYYKNGFNKSYKANKFYVSSLGYSLPELKNSSQLYHASDGTPHPYINPNAIPTVRARTDIAKYERDNDRCMHTTRHLLELLYVPWMGNQWDCPDDNRYWPDPNDPDYINKLWEFARQSMVNHSMVHVNEYNGNFYVVYLNTRNIFDYYTILQNRLFNYEYTYSNPCPLEFGWINADDC